MNKNEKKQEWIGMVVEKDEDWWKEAWDTATGNEKSLVEKFVEVIWSKQARDITNFNVRNEFLKEVAGVDNEVFRAAFEKEFGKNVSEIDEIDNVLALTALGKIWARKMSYDYDASLLMNCIYYRVYSLFHDKYKMSKSVYIDRYGIERENKYEYIFTHKEKKVTYRGDTMNSWSTTVNEFMRVFGKDYVKDYQGRYIPYGYNSWEAYLSNPSNYIKILPCYITEFMKVVYTMGNFMPVPQTPVSFNVCRSQFTSDYWDLTLLAIYDYYMDRSEKKYLTLGLVLGGKPIEEWLQSFGEGQEGWNNFVKKNFMQPFVIGDENKGFGRPRELWDGHFTGCRIPKEEWQFEQFFVNATKWILERGGLVAEEFSSWLLRMSGKE